MDPNPRPLDLTIDDYDDEPCELCGAPMYRDEDGDWNHVMLIDGVPYALTLLCEGDQGRWVVAQ